MREILFRAKRTNDGKWVEGYYARLYYQQEHWIFDGTIFLNTGSPCRYSVIPETVGQYTSLVDKNGAKVFEGDIVRAYGGEYYGGFYEINEDVLVRDITDGVCVHLDNVEFIEVIGNVFDNPELLEGGENNADKNDCQR